MKRFLFAFVLAMTASASYAEMMMDTANDGLDCMCRCIDRGYGGSTCEKVCGG